MKVRFLGLGIGEDLGLELAIQMAEVFHIVFIMGLVNNSGGRMLVKSMGLNLLVQLIVNC